MLFRSLSLKIAAINATGAVILGTLAGLALARFGRFKGRTLLTGLTTAPMVMPEVITGLAMLLLFVAMQTMFGWPAGRGVTTITIAHITFSMAYVTVVIQSRLLTLDESLATLPRAAFDYVWLIHPPAIPPRRLAGMTRIWGNGEDALYRIDHKRLSPGPLPH